MYIKWLYLIFKNYIESLDDVTDEELYTTEKGFAMREFERFLEFYKLDIPDWVKEYYES